MQLRDSLLLSTTHVVDIDARPIELVDAEEAEAADREKLILRLYLFMHMRDATGWLYELHDSDLSPWALKAITEASAGHDRQNYCRRKKEEWIPGTLQLCLHAIHVCVPYILLGIFPLKVYGTLCTRGLFLTSSGILIGDALAIDPSWDRWDRLSKVSALSRKLASRFWRWSNDPIFTLLDPLATTAGLAASSFERQRDAYAAAMVELKRRATQTHNCMMLVIGAWYVGVIMLFFLPSTLDLACIGDRWRNATTGIVDEPASSRVLGVQVGWDFVVFVSLVHAFPFLCLARAAWQARQRPLQARVHAYDELLKLLSQRLQVYARIDGGQPAPIKAALAMYFQQNPNSVQVNTRYQGSTLVTGKPENAALGLSIFMRVDDDAIWAGMARGVVAIEEEFANHGTDADRECLEYVLHGRAGESGDRGFDLFHKRPPDERRGQPFAYFVNHPDSRRAHLKASHVLALRMYTTPAFASMNDPLRSQSTEPHPFAVTVALLADAIKKLRAVGAQSADAHSSVELWRGMRNMVVTDEFLSSGGTEMAPMSTTTDLDVALDFSDNAEARLLFKLCTSSFMERGAEVSYLSVFPDEMEILYPPLTLLHPTGKRERVEVGEGVRFDVVEVRPHLPS